MKRTFPAKVIEEEQRVIMTTAAAQAPAPGKLEFKDDYTPDEAERVIRNSKGLPVGVRPKMVWTWKKALLWAAIAIVCACGWAILAVSRGERISAIWFLVVALSSYAIAYRFYAYYIQIKIMRTDDANATPAERVHDGANFERTDRRVLFGQHFAGISGALLAMYQTTVQANTFKSAMTYEILLIVVIGGIGSISGSCIDYIRKSLWAAELLGADTIVIHSGSAGKMSRAEAMRLSCDTLARVVEAVGDTSIRLGIETMGKVNQLGTLDEVIEQCRVDPHYHPVVDFGHMNARERGGLFPDCDSYRRVFSTVAERLGDAYARHLHCHFSRIAYTDGGEKRHLTFADEQYGPAFEPLMEAIVREGVCPRIICESDGTMAEDALTMKRYWQSLNG